VSRHPLLELVAADESVADALQPATLPGCVVDITAVPPLTPPLLALLAEPASAAEQDSTLLVVTGTTRQAEELAQTLGGLLDPDRVAVFPAWETLPYERLSPSADVVGKRLTVLRRLRESGVGPLQRPSVVVAPARAMLQPIVAAAVDLDPVRVRAGDETDPGALARRLVSLGYLRVELVERRGHFAIRGGILDIFPPTEEHPVRLEFWGDTVEEVRSFSVADQRSLDELGHGLWAPPCRELPLTDQVRERAAAQVPDHPQVADLLHAVAEGRAAEGMELLGPLLVDDMRLLVDFVPRGSRVAVLEPDRIAERAADLQATSAEFLAATWHNSAMAGGKKAPVDVSGSGFRDLASVREAALAAGLGWVGMSAFAGAAVLGAAAPTFRGDLTAAAGMLRSRLERGSQVLVQTRGPGVAKRLTEALGDLDVPTSSWPPAPAGATGPKVPKGAVGVGTGPLADGFELPASHVLVLTESDLLGVTGGGRATRSRMPSRRRKSLDVMTLAPGDHLVHDKHGVGRFVEMVTRDSGGTTREYLVVEYSASRRGLPPDRLYIPTDQLDMISRYVGAETPKLSKMGGDDWARAKGKARKAVREIAGELIRLYRRRQATPGHAFGPDSPWQAELEGSFDYVETPDQSACIEDVKADMEKPVPMDRVVCGDVGYGKTEIAVRAAFKAIQDGKQVALLVPTTLLVQQHLRTFAERYAAFPVTIAALSRFTSRTDQKKALEGITSGAVDLVIGTHALLSANVRFKDLGLVIVDEEQRFGVEHKEHLKALRANVDFLTMSATPIPRTLEMSVTGIREMSTIATPPEERLPVLTAVGPYDRRQVTAAIRRELMRDGQVFLVHNRVQSIDKVAKEITEMVPEAQVAVAHGQMGEGRLEQIIVDFWDKRIDVLVCTTIVESGIDIPNANTLLVDRADTLGLSQMHQLRGRVGRGRDRAYAYFMYPADKTLSQTSYDRLATIAANTELGAGMQIAMKDLEIRGAGNLLGGEQSGHIADVGFDLYVRMVGEALTAAKGEAPPDTVELNVTLPVEAHLPEDYITGQRLRLEAYRSLAAAHTEDGIDAVLAEWTDRYGPLPDAAAAVVAMARFRVLAHRAGLSEVVQEGTRVRLYPVELPESRIVRLTRMYKASEYRPATRQLLVTPPRPHTLGAEQIKGQELLQWLQDLLVAILLD